MRKEPTPINDFSLLIGHHKSFVFDVIQQPFFLHLNSDPSTMLWFWCIFAVFFLQHHSKDKWKDECEKKAVVFYSKINVNSAKK